MMMRHGRLLKRWLAMAGLVAVSQAGSAVWQPARADRIENSIAVFSALDKVTARISRIEVPLNQTKEFGSLKVTPRVCFSRPPTEQPKTTSFVEVDETMIDGTEKRLFSGWMFAESPGLNAVEHPVFDVWLTDCVTPGQSTAAANQPSAGNQDAGRREAEPEPRRRRRVRR